MAVNQARADLARLQSEIKRLENQLLVAKQRAEKVANYIEMSELYSSGMGVTASATRSRSGKSAAAADMVAQILGQKGHPIPTRDLLKELESKGIIFDSHNPVTNLSSALSRSPLLVGDRTEGWSLAEWKSQPPRSDNAPSESADPWTIGEIEEEEVEEEDEGEADIDWDERF